MLLLVLLGACNKAPDEDWATVAPIPILVEPNLPEARKNAVLHVTIRDSRRTISGSRSLDRPSGGGGSKDGSRSECEWEALAAIRKDRFVVLFTKKKNDGRTEVVTSKAVSFPFGVTTETDVSGFHVIGKFE